MVKVKQTKHEADHSEKGGLELYSRRGMKLNTLIGNIFKGKAEEA